MPQLTRAKFARPRLSNNARGLSGNHTGPSDKTRATLRRIAIALLLAGAAGCAAGQSKPAETKPPESNPSESDVKAAYVFDFAKFIRLADGVAGSRSATFDICLLGHDTIGRQLEAITANQSMGGRQIRVVRVEDAYAGRGCDILFISADEGDGIHADLAALGKVDALTVSDAPDFLDQGGMVQFVMVDNHVRFAVNLDAVNRTHLVLSSELLRVASAVTGKPSAEGLP